MQQQSAIDLSQLPAPAVVELLDFDSIKRSMLSDLQARSPDFTALLESDPALKLIEVFAYRELMLRARINDACYALTLAYAQGADLDQIAGNYNVRRLVVDPGNPDAVPPVPPVLESDTALRLRTQLSLESYSTAGPAGAYVFHAMSASGQVLDATAVSPTPGQVNVYVLGTQAGGVPSAEVLDAVRATLDNDNVRPLTDTVTVLPATVERYNVAATISLYPGPDAVVVLRAAQDAVRAYCASVFRLGYDVARSGLIRALHQPGVQSVTLTSPAADIAVGDGTAALLDGLNIDWGGSNV